MNLQAVWRSKTLHPHERIALVRMHWSLACPSGKGPEYHRLVPADLVASCGFTEHQAARLWREFYLRGWIVEIVINDGGPDDGKFAWTMPKVAGYEL